MNDQGKKTSALDDIRVLDLAGQMGIYCTKLLADLGADVIKIESPQGDPTRSIGPFYHDDPDPEKSLYFFQFNTNKRGITLNIYNADGRELLKKLVKTADIIVESFPPGHLDELDVGYPVLKEINPGLVLTSITGFGQNGPYKDFKAPDIVGMAMGGLMNLSGFAEDPPNLAYGSQAFHMASLHATVATLIALYQRDLTGEGQQVDVSMQQCVLIAQETAMQYYDLRKEVCKRQGGVRVGPNGFRLPGVYVYPCKDGHVMCHAVLGMNPWVEWMVDEGMVEDLKEEKWQELLDRIAYRDKLIAYMTALLNDRQALAEFLGEMKHVEDVLAAFLLTHTKQELYEEGQRRRNIVVPVSSSEDIVNDIQLNYRGYFHELEHPELGDTLQYPGSPYRLSETPWRLERRSPLLGEHNLEVYEGELGYNREQLTLLKDEGAI